MENLQNTIKSILDSSDFNYGFILKDLLTGDIIELNSNERFNSASIIKLFYLYEALIQIDKKTLSLDDMFLLDNEEKVGGAGVLNMLHNTLNLTLNDLLTLMITVSDNTATNILFDILGKDNINQDINNIDIKDTLVARKLMRVIPGIYNYTTAKDTAKILEELFIPNTLSKISCDLAIDILNLQKYNDDLSRDLIECSNCGELIGHLNTCPSCNTYIGDISPKLVEFPHKTGEITGIVHDAGILGINHKNYVVVLLTSGHKNNFEAKKIMGEIGLLIYKYIKKNRGIYA
ncbi:MAG: serine hydrolase [Clostridiales bacterium]|nr:serine hydrolase [Clostridiales bacterium]